LQCYSQQEKPLWKNRRIKIAAKGAMDEDKQSQGGNTSMQGQLGHRDENVELKNADSNLAG
jgi:hypothetical protein